MHKAPVEIFCIILPVLPVLSLHLSTRSCFVVT